jgi:hypothetical protein
VLYITYCNMSEDTTSSIHSITNQYEEDTNNVRYITCNLRLVKGKSIQTKPIYKFIQENYEIKKSIGTFDNYRKGAQSIFLVIFV